MWMLLTPLAQASPWVEPAGRARVGVAASSLVSRRQFAGGESWGLTGPLCPEPVTPGDRMPYSCVTGGAYVQRSASAFAMVGLGHRIAVDLTLPVVAAGFEDSVERTDAWGLGDLRFGARYGLVDSGGWAVAGALHLQAPTGPGTFQDRDVPLGTGQWDVVPGVRVGRSLHPWGWVEGWQEVAVRLRNPLTGTDPGEESRTTVALGLTPVPEAGVQLRAETLLALPDRDAFGLPHPGRSLLQVRAAGFARPTEAAWIELGVAIPLAGRRWPSAAAPYASLSWLFGRSEELDAERGPVGACPRQPHDDVHRAQVAREVGLGTGPHADHLRVRRHDAEDRLQQHGADVDPGGGAVHRPVIERPERSHAGDRRHGESDRHVRGVDQLGGDAGATVQDAEPRAPVAAEHRTSGRARAVAEQRRLVHGGDHTERRRDPERGRGADLEGPVRPDQIRPVLK